MSLRIRLIASYLLMLVATLVIMVATLLLFASRQSVPPTETYRDLLSIARGNQLELATMLRPAVTARVQNNRAERLTSFATSHEVRIMLVNTRAGTVTFDSAGVYPIAGETLEMRVDPNFSVSQFRSFIRDLPNAIAGSFNDEAGTLWHFVGLELNNNPDEALVMGAIPSQRTLRTALSELGSSLGVPVLQSAVLGFIVALLLAALVSATIARPLQHLAKAAHTVSGGDYDHRIKPEGPPEIRAVAESFNHMIDEVLKTQQSQRDFLANVSHDLKTPLTSIQGYSQAIMDGAVKDLNYAAGIIHDEAGRLTRMVSELTDLARLQAGAIKMQLAVIDVAQIVDAITQRVRMVAERKRITLNTDIQPLPAITGDGDRLAQVFTNLISNAINYTPEGGSVWVRAIPNRGGVEISVRDTGIGIPQAELARIFERFYQVDKTRGPRRGTGLGLAITREIVVAHGGEVTVTSPGEGKGSTFTIWLPLGRVSDAAA